MDRLRVSLPDIGFGSRPELVAYITEVLEHNTVMRPEKDYITPERLASNMLYSILHRLGIEQQLPTEVGVTEHDWVPGRWYRILSPDGSLWMETSDREEAEQESEAKGWPLQRLWRCETAEWRPVKTPATATSAGPH